MILLKYNFWSKGVTLEVTIVFKYQASSLSFAISRQEHVFSFKISIEYMTSRIYYDQDVFIFSKQVYQ